MLYIKVVLTGTKLYRTYNEEHPGYEHPARNDFEERWSIRCISSTRRPKDFSHGDMMDAYEKGGEEELAKEMKMSMEELDDESDAYFKEAIEENGLHMDDAMR